MVFLFPGITCFNFFRTLHRYLFLLLVYPYYDNYNAIY